MSDRVSIPALLARRAAENPDRTFATEVDGRTVTVGAFQDEALRWAAGLRDLGVGPGDNVVTMVLPRIASFASWIGTSWLRAVDVSCNTDYRGRMLAYILNDAEAKVAIVAERFLERFVEVTGDATRLETVVVPDAVDVPAGLPWRVLAGADVVAAAPAPDLDAPDIWDLAAMVYTSGTTGRSKGVLVPWGQMYEYADGVIPAADVDESDVFYSSFPMFHGSGRVPLCLMVQANGRFVLREHFSGSEFWRDIRAHGCTTTGFVGAMSQFVWSQEPRADDAENPLRRAVMLPVIPQWREFEKRFGLRLRTCYAMTETGPTFGTGWDIPDHLTCGSVREGYEVRLVDEHDERVPAGAVGELVVRTGEPWMLCSGYFGMPEPTAAAWRNGWFHTGDAFRADDGGNYFFVDRIKDTIRRRGENISSFEVESLVNEHPEVVETAAIAVPSEWGEDDLKIVVVRADGSSLDQASLLDDLAERMPRFMVPRYIEFAEQLPKTDATQRVRKVELRANALNDRTWDREAVSTRSRDARNVG
jgi:crotonobetaine/carnitine-CoA ligase